MWSIVREIISSPAGSFGFVFALLCFAGWVIYYITKKVTTINAEHSQLQQSTKKIEDYIDELRRDMAYLKGTLEVRSDLAKSHSPVSLTEKGKEVSKEMNAEAIVSNNWYKIYQTLESEVGGKNAYDIQQYCIETAAVEPEKFFEKEDLERLKLFAYNKGRSFQYFSITLAIIIRDKYFEVKGINTQEIDVHDPKKQ